MIKMMETYKAFAPDKDLDSFKIGYLCRQEHIDVLEEENVILKTEKKSYEQNKAVMSSLERLFKGLLKHENSDCSYCLYCDNQWKIIEMIQDKLDELKG